MHTKSKDQKRNPRKKQRTHTQNTLCLITLLAGLTKSARIHKHANETRAGAVKSVPAKTLFERLYLILGLAPIGALSHLSVCSQPSSDYSTTISRFLVQFCSPYFHSCADSAPFKPNSTETKIIRQFDDYKP